MDGPKSIHVKKMAVPSGCQVRCGSLQW